MPSAAPMSPPCWKTRRAISGWDRRTRPDASVREDACCVILRDSADPPRCPATSSTRWRWTATAVCGSAPVPAWRGARRQRVAAGSAAPDGGIAPACRTRSEAYGVVGDPRRHLDQRQRRPARTWIRRLASRALPPRGRPAGRGIQHPAPSTACAMGAAVLRRRRRFQHLRSAAPFRHAARAPAVLLTGIDVLGVPLGRCAPGGCGGDCRWATAPTSLRWTSRCWTSAAPDPACRTACTLSDQLDRPAGAAASRLTNAAGRRLRAGGACRQCRLALERAAALPRAS